MPRPELDAMGFGFIRAVGGSCHVVVRRAMYGIGESIEREFDSYTDDFGATPALATLDRAEPVRQAGNGALCELPTHALPFSLGPTPTSCGVDLVNRGHGAGVKSVSSSSRWLSWNKRSAASAPTNPPDQIPCRTVG